MTFSTMDNLPEDSVACTALVTSQPYNVPVDATTAVDVAIDDMEFEG
jgi:hypothetical protein